MSGNSDRYMDWNGCLKQGSLDNTASFKHDLWHLTKIISSGIYKTVKWNVALVNCTHCNWIQCRWVQCRSGSETLHLV